MNINKAIEAIGERKTVTCTVGKGAPVTYKVKYIEDTNNAHYGEECLTVNDKVYDMRDFSISISQILCGKWKVVDELEVGKK